MTSLDLTGDAPPHAAQHKVNFHFNSINPVPAVKAGKHSKTI